MTKTLYASFPENGEMQDKKTGLRRHFCALRNAIPPEKALERARAATAHLVNDSRWLAAQHIALYVDFKHELSTQFLLEHLWSQGKTVYLPRCVPGDEATGQGNTLQFFACQGREDVFPGTWGILEPDPARCAPLGEQLPDMLIMPAVALDRQGFRLGYGGGYYDRLLQDTRWNALPRVGLVYSCQIIAELPREPWDKPVHALACEEAVTWL